MKWQDRPRSENIQDIRNYNQFEMFLFDSQNELSGIGSDLFEAVTGPFRGEREYMVVPTNYNSDIRTNPVTDERLRVWREQNGVNPPELGGGLVSPLQRNMDSLRSWREQKDLTTQMSQPRKPR